MKNRRFRQDGVEKNPHVVEQSGVLPFRAGAQAQKYLQIMRFIPEKTNNLLYNQMTDIERVSYNNSESSHHLSVIEIAKNSFLKSIAYTFV